MKVAGKNHLKGARVYLSGPMDFVASRAKEKKYGWRNRISQFLKSYGVTVFDPWNKPNIRGLYEYGREDEITIKAREDWTYETDVEGIAARGACAATFWETLHIDLRMVDISDFIIAYCPTNIYSVGTVHEIVVARQQRKPVLFVSPRVEFPILIELKKELRGNPKTMKLLGQLKSELPIKENVHSIPSLWYMPLVGSENFFDGFGFHDADYIQKYKWMLNSEVDDRERKYCPKRPLLKYIDEIAAGNFPKRWEHRLKKLVDNDDWLLMDQSLSHKGE